MVNFNVKIFNNFFQQLESHTFKSPTDLTTHDNTFFLIPDDGLLKPKRSNVNLLSY